MKKWADIKAKKMTPERIERVKAEARAELLELSLRELREASGRTQAELAALADMTQSALSRIERREDNPVDAVRRYVEALGGKLEIVAVLGSKRVTLLGV